MQCAIRRTFASSHWAHKGVVWSRCDMKETTIYPLKDFLTAAPQWLTDSCRKHQFFGAFNKCLTFWRISVIEDVYDVIMNDSTSNLRSFMYVFISWNSPKFSIQLTSECGCKSKTSFVTSQLLNDLTSSYSSLMLVISFMLFSTFWVLTSCSSTADIPLLSEQRMLDIRSSIALLRRFWKRPYSIFSKPPVQRSFYYLPIPATCKKLLFSWVVFCRQILNWCTFHTVCRISSTKCTKSSCSKTIYRQKKTLRLLNDVFRVNNWLLLAEHAHMNTYIIILNGHFRQFQALRNS